MNTCSQFKRNHEETLESLKTKQRVVLEIEQKREIIAYHDMHPSLSQQKLADYFSDKFQLKSKIARNTISTILSKRKLYFEAENANQHNSKRIKLSKNPLLEKCLMLWYTNLASKNILISNKMLVEQAKKFGEIIGISDIDLKYSSGLLEKFKEQNDHFKNNKHLIAQRQNLSDSSLDPSLSNDNEDNNCQNLTRDDRQNDENNIEKNEVNKNEDTLYIDEIAELATESNEYNEPANETTSSFNIYSTSNKNFSGGIDELKPFDVNSEKKKRVVLDLDQKREIILYHDEFPNVSQQNIADYFSNKFQFKTKIARNTISTILSKRNLYFQPDNNNNNNNNKNKGHKSASDSNELRNEFSNFENFNIPEDNDNYQEHYFNNQNTNDYSLTIEEIIELARASEFNETVNSSNELNEEDPDQAAAEDEDVDENTFIKIEPKSYTKSDALIGLENIQGILMQTELLDENDLEYISKLKSKLDLIN